MFLILTLFFHGIVTKLELWNFFYLVWLDQENSQVKYRREKVEERMEGNGSFTKGRIRGVKLTEELRKSNYLRKKAETMLTMNQGVRKEADFYMGRN